MKLKINKKLKPVRIDQKTVIMVSEDIPDDVARNKFMNKLNEYKSRYGNK